MIKRNPINQISATAIPLRGNDIDTDRIIPARFLKCVVFDELGPHAFEDDRADLKSRNQIHPFDDNKYARAGILIVEKNFGCGSSREHAPQSLMRRGIKAIVGVSFAEIFFGNCVSLGIPCVTAEESIIHDLIEQIEKSPQTQWTVDVAERLLSGDNTYQVGLADGIQKQFIEGDWNPLDSLLDAKAEIDQVAEKIPYF